MITNLDFYIYAILSLVDLSIVNTNFFYDFYSHYIFYNL
jgi:hypothetical protein